MGTGEYKEAPAGSQYPGEAAGYRLGQRHDLSATDAHQNQPSPLLSCYDPGYVALANCQSFSGPRN